MAPSHEKTRRGTRAGDDEFVLYLQGVPAHCRWQELKDFVRQTAQHIRQAVVYDDPHGYPTGIGQIIVKNEDEAWRTFRKLAATGWDGQVLTVTLAKASAPTKPIAGPKQSPPASLPRFSFGMGNGGNNQSVPSDPVATGYLPAPPLMNYVHAYPASTTSWTANPEAHPFLPSPAVFPFNQMEYHYYPTTSSMNPPPQHPQHMYGAATMDPTIFIPTMPYYHQRGVPAGYADLTTSAAFTLSAPGCCSVIVDNLHPGTDVQTLKSHFRKAGGAVVEHCEIANTSHHAKDRASTSSYAIAAFSSADEAAKAVSLCNGTMLSGNRIMVRFDLDCNRTVSGGGGLHVDEDWPLTAPLSATSSFFQPSASAFSEDGWNLFHSTTTTTAALSDSSSSASSSPPSSASSSSSSTASSSASPFVYKNPTTSASSSTSSAPSSSSNNASQRPAKHPSSSSSSNRHRRDSGKVLTSSQTNAKKTTDSRMSSEKQPLVVNGSMTGRAKM